MATHDKPGHRLLEAVDVASSRWKCICAVLCSILVSAGAVITNTVSWSHDAEAPVDESATRLSRDMLDRAIKLSPHRRAGLDGTVFGKLSSLATPVQNGFALRILPRTRAFGQPLDARPFPGVYQRKLHGEVVRPWGCSGVWHSANCTPRHSKLV
eukprot:gnl/TRDRNA2_/TRDRNA2_153322_c0_seq1.p2 gnl/TRDRNA2_/TRDRNA2_153322_c0~~gnl/TRDRNA2_/TRDRNA2_153322_c0_seq1.p2  ORF type:complete len:155 (-),score=13.32 gnl/TRDRNA2_/TRDRNA2_153322_c0_seq1:37-501(-)